MAAGSTYTPIATTTLGSTATSYTFSSIPSTYTDLVLIISGKSTGPTDAWLQFNSDTATNYSDTRLYGNGTSAVSERNSNAVKTYLDSSVYLSTNQCNYVVSIMNYSNTTTYKTVLSRFNNSAVGTNTNVGLWRSTSAINSVKIGLDGNSYDIGTSFTLYGIKAA